MKFIHSIASLVLFLGLGTAAQAQEAKYTFDQAHTQVRFSVNHLGFSNSSGEFLQTDGYFIFDEKKPDKSVIDVTIPTASIEMNDQKWNDHLKNEDFFNVEKYPTMTFKSTNVEVTSDNTATVTGDLTLLGVTKPVTLDVTLNKVGPHPMSGKQMAGFSASGTLKRSEFGMNYGLPMVGDDVDLRIEVEGVQEGAANTDAGNE